MDQAQHHFLDKHINQVIAIEGGYSNNHNDSGGKTRFGITERTARRYGYIGEIFELPRETAARIYRDSYWLPLNLDSVCRHSETIAAELFDSAVNVGTHRAAEWLQRCLNVLNSQQEFWHDLSIDGDIGPQTLSALGDLFERRGDTAAPVLLKMLNSLQGAFYIGLAERREKDEAFIFGWIKARVA